MFENNASNANSISTGTIVRFFLVALAFFLVWYLRELVLVVFTAIVIASFVEAVVPYLEKMKLGRVFGIFLLYVFLLSGIASLFYLFAPLLITEVYNFSVALSAYVPGIYFLDYFQNQAFSGAKDVVAGLSDNLSLASLLAVSKAFLHNLTGGFFQTLSVAFGSLLNVFLIVIISFYLSIQKNGIEDFLKVILPLKYEEYAVDLWIRSRRKIALWLKGQMLLGFLVGVLIYLLLSLLGVEYALLFAILAGVMELVPYGSLIASIPAVSFSFFSGGASLASMVAISYLIVHQFEVFLFTPLIIKKIVGLSPIIIILSVLTGLALGGFWGVLLAIPIAVIVMELVSDIEKHKALFREKNEQK